ncbi:hypothetical protein AJ79_03611 [Helicocarpus griseus UAMH5409]|uniref:Serine hydrolase domain-containing protein n=1 Tax=Helicocarpus griseus UAMH5409 TaxID=1447875 RepID=A0A2B7XXI5_9EURO|nr:hypothetical protein AJ79_03611 [Helicocarpus griseus UAMH5409]
MPPPLPAILCLHGSGTSAEIFKIQTLRLRRELQHRFSFVFLDGPFETSPGPGVLPVFADEGPYFTWVDPTASDPPPRSLERKDEDDRKREGKRGRTQLMPKRTVDVLEEVVRRQIEKDGKGFVGVLGFSMGGRLAAGLLMEQQWRIMKEQKTVNGEGDTNENGVDGSTTTVDQEQTFKFGVFICGTSPPITKLHDLLNHDSEDREEAKVRLPQIDIPTLHVLGLNDPWFTQGEVLAATHFTPAKRTVRRLEMGHHLPVQKQDNMLVVEGILEMAKKVGV